MSSVVEVLRLATFQRFLLAAICSGVGVWIFQTAMYWAGLQAGSTETVGLLVAAISIPSLVLTLPAGVLTDRAGPFRLLVIGQVAPAIACLAGILAVQPGGVIATAPAALVTLVAGTAYPRVAFVFDGLGPDELIGDQPNLQTGWGAAGYEIDRFDHELGTPASALLLASSVGLSERYRPMIDEVLWFIPGRDGQRPDDPQVDGEPHRFVRSDIAYLEYPNGGAVVSVGSIAWRGGIAHNDYDNTVSTVTGNVLRRFAERPRGTSPSDLAYDAVARERI